MNLHNVVSVTAEVRRSSGSNYSCEWVTVTFTTEDGSTFAIAAHTDDAAALLSHLTGVEAVPQ